MRIAALWAGAMIVLWVATPAIAAPPASAPGCGLSVASIVQDDSAWIYCLDPAVPKSDWDNLSLATAGPVLYPGNPVALATARAWEDQVDFDLLHDASHIGQANDIASWSLTRNANYVGGTPGFVNSGLRITTNVGPNVTAFEWSIVGIVNSASPVSQSVGVYGQGNGNSRGTTWGMVAEAKANVPGGTAVGIEVDAGGTSGTNAVGVDVVNTGGMKAAVRVAPGVPALVSAADPGTYIAFTASGGMEFYVHGVRVQAFQ